LGISRFVTAAALGVALLPLHALAALGGDATVTLGALEAAVDRAPGLAAAQQRIDADVAAEGVATAREGLDYFFSDALGPRSDIVTKNVNDNAFRYSQSAGVQLPLLGTAIGRENSLEAARTDESLARIDYAENRRGRIAALRTAYVLYWQYGLQLEIAERYVREYTVDLKAARALRRNGFWTEGNLLDFLDALTRFEADARALRTSKRAQLAAIASAIGVDVAAFRPVEPGLANGCEPLRDATIRSAAEVDPSLARIAAQADLLAGEARRVRGSSIDASAQFTLGNAFDLIPPRAGYEVTAGLTATLPTHARSEERARRTQLRDELDEQSLLADQRRAEIGAAIEAALDDLSNARNDLAQTVRNERAKREDLREAIVRFHTLNAAGAGGFTDVETARTELFDAENATAIARGNVYLKANVVLQAAPEACS
jgi:outer membrane protein TolC